MWGLGTEGREHRELRWKTLKRRVRCQGSEGTSGSLVWASHHLQPLFSGSRPVPGLSPPEARGADTLVTGRLLVGSPNTWELVPEEDALPLGLYVVRGINKPWGGEGLFLIVAMLTPEPWVYRRLRGLPLLLAPAHGRVSDPNIGLPLLI